MRRQPQRDEARSSGTPPGGAVSQTLERGRENCRRKGKSLPEKEARGLLGRGKCGTKALKLGRVWSPGEAGRRTVAQKQE